MTTDLQGRCVTCMQHWGAEQRASDAEFARNFNMQQWNACTIALKENMATIHELEAKLSDAESALAACEAKLATSEAEAKQSAIDTDFWAQQAADIAKEHNEWLSKAEASEATVARRTAALEILYNASKGYNDGLMRSGLQWEGSTSKDGKPYFTSNELDVLADTWINAIEVTEEVMDALASTRSQAEETDDQVPPNSPAPLPGTSAQAGRTPRVRLR